MYLSLGHRKIAIKTLVWRPSPEAIVNFQFRPETENKKENRVNPVNPV
jgi:hypothetical protein